MIESDTILIHNVMNQFRNDSESGTNDSILYLTNRSLEMRLNQVRINLILTPKIMIQF